MYAFPVAQRVCYGKTSVAFGTVIQQLIRPFRGAWTVLTGFAYTAAGTAHTGIVRMAIGKTNLFAAAATGQAVIVLNAQPTTARNVAANDYLVIESHDTTNVGTGTGAGQPPPIWDIVKVTSVVGTTITLTANCVRAYAAGDTVWLMSLSSDAVPGFAAAPPQYTFPSGATTTFPAQSALTASGGMVSSINQHEPLILESNNITATGTLEYAAACGMKAQSPHAA